MSYPYPSMSTINATTDATQILVYINTITNNWFGIAILFAFFFIALIGGYYAQVRFKGRGQIGVCFAAASFVSVGFAMLMSMTNGLINPFYVWFFVGLSALGALWVFFSTSTAE